MFFCFRTKQIVGTRFFLSENFQFLEVKFSIYLNRRVFVMKYRISERTTVKKNVTLGNMIIDRGEAVVDNHIPESIIFFFFFLLSPS